MRLIFSVILAMAAFFATPAFAATAGDEQLWFQTFAQGSVKGDLLYLFELQSRFGGDGANPNQVIMRPAVGVKLSDRVSVYQGYAYVRSPRSGSPDVGEDRSFQQLNLGPARIAGVAFTSRTRLEQRWLTTGNDMGWRLRQLVRFAVPLTNKARGVAAIGTSEVFIALNDTDWGARGGFDRIRNFVGVEVPLSGKSTVELGYLNQHVDARGPNNGMNHVLAINLMLRP